MKFGKGIIIAMFFCIGALCVGCGTDLAGEEEKLPTATSTSVSVEETGIEDLTETTVTIHVFTQDDMAVIPEVKEYDFATAQEVGITEELQGWLPGMAEGTWYVIEIDGLEYYYGKYDCSEEITFWGYSIISNQYSLANGIMVGMKQEELLAEYQDMAVMDFEGNYLQKEVTGNLGWNSAAYPPGFQTRFDCVMFADIDLGTYDTLPIYVGLLMKDDTVAAITFYYPTAN